MLNSTDLLSIEIALEKAIEHSKIFINDKNTAVAESVAESAKNNVERFQNTLEKIKKMREEEE